MKRYRERVFPLLAGALWVWFLALDIFRLGDSTWIKFAGICLCCLTALLGAKTPDGRLVSAALCLTVGADWFLLILDDHYAMGIGLFILVQLLYACRLYLLRDGGITPLLFIRLLALGIGGYVALRSNLVSGLALFYFVNLAVNTAEAFALGRADRRFALGLLLFVCCDLCVGAWNLHLLPGFTRVGMWLFYLPSQVLIVLSQEQEKGDLDEKTV